MTLASLAFAILFLVIGAIIYVFVDIELRKVLQ